MKIVVIGGTGLIGSRVIAKLTEHGHEAIAASPNSGVNTLTGEGLADVLVGADVVVDVSNSPSFDDGPVMDFFTTSTRNQLAAEAEAGVTHHVALSIVGTELLPDIGYFRAKVAQEKLIRQSGIPYSIVHATQFFEFAKSIADGSTDGNVVTLSRALMRPIAAEDVATAVARTAASAPLNGDIEIAGPEVIELDDLARRRLESLGDPRAVVADDTLRYFGAVIPGRELIPGEGAQIFETTFDQWLQQQSVAVG